MSQKILLYALLFVAVLVILIIFGSRQQSVADPPLSGAPYELTGTPIPKGDRILGIDVTPAGDNDFDSAFNLAKSAGMQTAAISINWDQIETEPGTYTDPYSALATTNAYYPPNKTRIALYIRSVDTTSKPVPAYLKDTRYDDPKMLAQYLKMIDWVFSQIPQVELEFLSIGDEIDIMMGENKELYQQFEVFFRAARAQIKTTHPHLKIGFSATLDGLTRNVPQELAAINQHSDIVLVSYYPVNGDFSVKDPQVVYADYDALVQRYQGKVIYIEQTGIPTSATLDSSEAKQREFIRATFKAWDEHAEHIKYVSFTWLHDLSQETVDFYKSYYGSDDQRFLEYLRTLGFRTNPGAGQDKEAFRAIKAEAKARGWEVNGGAPPSDVSVTNANGTSNSAQFTVIAMKNTWTKHPANPVMNEGRIGAWRYQPGDPFVMKDEGVYKMWFGANDEEQGITQVGYAESRDGIDWEIHPEPVLRPGTSAAYDATVVETPTVVKDGNGTYHMWYSSVNKFGGDGDEAIYRIGHATSQDGIRWTKDRNNPVIRPVDFSTNDWNSWGVLEPTVIREDGIYKMWFDGLVVDAPDYKTAHHRVGYATSKDGSEWEVNKAPILELCTGPMDKFLNSAFFILHSRGAYELWYLGGECPDVHATSKDGIHWEGSQGTILQKGAPGQWDSWALFAPAIIFDEGKYKMWYSGVKIDDSGWHHAIGYSVK